jgi:hypothetical protein
MALDRQIASNDGPRSFLRDRPPVRGLPKKPDRSHVHMIKRLARKSTNTLILAGSNLDVMTA